MCISRCETFELGFIDRVSLYDMEEGAVYRCQRCAKCCQWPGEVPLSDREVEKISEHLRKTVYDFVAEFTELRLNRVGLTLKEKENGECVFLDGIECTIQEVKPDQCAGFPNRWNFPDWRSKCEAVPEFGEKQ
ncbi:MAG: YkgJ family cysteine cluster protein [Verrucomicrobiota bacterium]